MLQRLLLGSKWRVFVTYAAVALIPLLVFGTYVTLVTQRNLRAREAAIKSQIAGSAADALDAQTNTLLKLGISFADRPYLQQAIRDGETETVVEHLESLVLIAGDVDRVMLVDMSGRVIARTAGADIELGADRSYRDWYRGVLADWTPHVSEVYLTAASEPYETFSIGVPVGPVDEPLGVLGIVPGPDFVADLMRGFEEPGRRSLYVLDESGQMLYLTSGAQSVERGSEHPVFEQAAVEGSGTFEGYDPAVGADVVAGYAVTRFGMTVIAEAKRDVAYEPVYAFIVWFAVVFATMAAIAILGAWTTAHLYEVSRERAEALERANADLESFSYSVSHDLRAPLRAIDGFSLLLQERYEPELDDEARRLIGVIRGNTSKMARLIDDLLAFSRAGRTPLECRRIDLSEVARSVLVDLRPQIEGRDISIEIGATPPVEADKAMMRQVLTNLLANAVKFTRDIPGARISFTAEVRPDQAIYCVKDNGAGFDPAYAGKLFGVFQRLHTSDQFEGTGIGLAIVKRVVERHGGHVWAESAVDEGAAFFFSLPSGVGRHDGR